MLPGPTIPQAVRYVELDKSSLEAFQLTLDLSDNSILHNQPEIAYQ